VKPAGRLEEAVGDVGAAEIGVLGLALLDLAGVDRELEPRRSEAAVAGRENDRVRKQPQRPTRGRPRDLDTGGDRGGLEGELVAAGDGGAGSRSSSIRSASPLRSARASRSIGRSPI
jgi:hypothetical protein